MAVLVRLLASTLRYEHVVEDGAEVGTPQSEGVWCFWHRCLLTCACYFYGSHRASILISRSFDGELIARTVRRLGFEAARGSSSRAGSSGLRELARAVKMHIPAIFPADGPRGPRYQLKPGPVKLAQMTGHPVGVFYLLPNRAWKLRSWDEFLIPKPFSHVIVSWARLVPIAREMNAVSFEQSRILVEQALERARKLAEAKLVAMRQSSAGT